MALEELADIGEYIANRNPVRAESFVKEVEAYCQKLVNLPHIGRQRPEIAAGLRSLVYGRYIIFYSVHDHEIHIEHILHGARDIEGFFEP
jgi:toxin ParE1/3/4